VVLAAGLAPHASLLVGPLLDTMPTIKRGGRGHPRRRPVKLHGDKGHDNPRVRRYLRRRGITARIARISRDSSARLGRHRWVVERTLGWLVSYKRLALRTTAPPRPSPRWPDSTSRSSALVAFRATNATSSKLAVSPSLAGAAPV
jgi:transposase